MQDNYPDILNNLPKRLHDAGLKIRVADIWDEASFIHLPGIKPGQDESNTYPYDSRGFRERLLSKFSPLVS